MQGKVAFLSLRGSRGRLRGEESFWSWTMEDGWGRDDGREWRGGKRRVDDDGCGVAGANGEFWGDLEYFEEGGAHGFGGYLSGYGDFY